jgi:hypothetical protein
MKVTAIQQTNVRYDMNKRDQQKDSSFVHMLEAAMKKKPQKK